MWVIFLLLWVLPQDARRRAGAGARDGGVAARNSISRDTMRAHPDMLYHLLVSLLLFWVLPQDA
jgi:hypothetical protein